MALRLQEDAGRPVPESSPIVSPTPVQATTPAPSTTSDAAAGILQPSSAVIAAPVVIAPSVPVPSAASIVQPTLAAAPIVARANPGADLSGFFPSPDEIFSGLPIFALGGVSQPIADAPYAVVRGVQIGLDNNYRYALYRDGRVENLYLVPDTTGEATRDTYASASELIAQGVDVANAPRDSHGVPQPAGYPAAGDPKPGPGGLGDFLGWISFTLLSFGFGSAAVAGAAAGEAGAAAAGAVDAIDASTGLFAGESAFAGTATYGTVGGLSTGAAAIGASVPADIAVLEASAVDASTGLFAGESAVAGTSTYSTVGGVATGAALPGAVEVALTGVDASTGLFAGESATAGTATYGTVGGGATGASLPTAAELAQLAKGAAPSLLQKLKEALTPKPVAPGATIAAPDNGGGLGWLVVGGLLLLAGH